MRHMIVYKKEDDEIKNVDVLLGRGNECTKHVGNIALRAVVDSKLDDFCVGCRADKSYIISQVTCSVYEAGGRFLRKNDQNEYFEVGNTKARLKVSQHLRDGVKCLLNTRKQNAVLFPFSPESATPDQKTFAEIVAFIVSDKNCRRDQEEQNDSSCSDEEQEVGMTLASMLSNAWPNTPYVSSVFPPPRPHMAWASSSVVSYKHEQGSHSVDRPCLTRESETAHPAEQADMEWWHEVRELLSDDDY